MFGENQNVGRKSECWEKIRMFGENQNVGKKSECWVLMKKLN